MNEKLILDPVLQQDWHVVARSTDLKEGQLHQQYLMGEALLLWRCNERVMAWSDRCPHRGVPLSGGWVESNQVVCPYHGLMFNADGHCTRIPADPKVASLPQNSSVHAYPVQERYGYVWVALKEPEQEIPVFQEWDQSGSFHFHCGPYFVNASPLRMIENFTDVAHFPFTHQGLLGDPAFPKILDYQVTVDDDGITAHNIQFYQPNPEGTGEAREVTYQYQIRRPLVAYFNKRSEDKFFSIFLAITPVAELQSIAWLGVSRNYAPDAPNDELRAFQDRLMAQDIPVVESQRPQRLPLDLQAEFHIPSDKLSIAYRKWLKQLGLQFGAC